MDDMDKELWFISKEMFNLDNGKMIYLMEKVKNILKILEWHTLVFLEKESTMD